MKKIYIYDTTLRDGEQAPGFSMSRGTKLQLAKSLADLGVDIVEAGFPASSEEHFETVKDISDQHFPFRVSALARAKTDDIKKAAQALEKANKGRIHIIVPSSDLLIQHQFECSRDEILEMSEKAILYATSIYDHVQLSLMDAMRADTDFLKKLAQNGVKAGAKIINLADSVGYAVPELIKEKIKRVKTVVPSEIIFSVHCHNDLGLALANTIKAALCGANQLECTLGGIGERSGNTALEECAMVLKIHEDRYGLKTAIKTEKLYEAVSLLFRLVNKEIPYNKAITGKNSFRHKSGIHQHGLIKNRTTYEPFDPALAGRKGSDFVIGAHSGIHGLQQKLQELNIEIPDSTAVKILDNIKNLKQKGDELTEEELLSLVNKYQ